MKMIDIGQCGICGIAPAFGIEVQTNGEIGMQLRIHQHRATSNFAVAIKQNFALKLDRPFLLGVFRIQNFVTRPRHAVLD